MGMSPSQDLHQGLFFFAFPDLGHHRVSPTAPQGLHSQVPIDQNQGAHPFPQNDHRNDLPETFDGTGQRRNPLRPLNPGMGIAKMKMGDLNFSYFSKMSGIHDSLLAPRPAPASTGKSIHHPTPASTKMTPPTLVQPRPGMNHKKMGNHQEFYNPPGNPFGRGIIHLFFIPSTESVPTTILPLPMSLLPFRGLSVTSLCLPVNSPPP